MRKTAMKANYAVVMVGFIVLTLATSHFSFLHRS
jgi:hypothetical protein